jgi:hypothetical protein
LIPNKTQQLKKKVETNPPEISSKESLGDDQPVTREVISLILA